MFQKKSEKTGTVFHFYNFSIWVNRRQIFTSASAFSLLRYHRPCSLSETPLFTIERMSKRGK